MKAQDARAAAGRRNGLAGPTAGGVQHAGLRGLRQRLWRPMRRCFKATAALPLAAAARVIKARPAPVCAGHFSGAATGVFRAVAPAWPARAGAARHGKTAPSACAPGCAVRWQRPAARAGIGAVRPCRRGERVAASAARRARRPGHRHGGDGRFHCPRTSLAGGCQPARREWPHGQDICAAQCRLTRAVGPLETAALAWGRRRRCSAHGPPKQRTETR